ncbi:MAG: DUF4254 domain-containing protein [Planctomycetales bacterium]|nr:DUF4254 domain-containing protein [Planctomycetales bacterium]
MPIDVKRVLELHRETVDRWHREDIDDRYDGIYGTICRQHSYNFRLWHEEDIARSRDVSDAQIAQVKRNIDKLNQQRNDWIEQIDEWIVADLRACRIAPIINAPLNTETPGSAIDRLSILALRLYHLDEQLRRTDAGVEHLASVRSKLQIGLRQQADLSQSLGQLLQEIYAGRKRQQTYRQMKMYNDPQLNPYLYERRKAG